MKIFCFLTVSIFFTNFAISQNDSISKFVAKWKYVGRYNTEGEQKDPEMNNEYRAQNFFMNLNIDGTYTKDQRASNKISTKRKQTKIKNRFGFWKYNQINQELIFEMNIEKDPPKHIKDEWIQYKDGIKYWIPIEYKVYLVDEKNLILFDAFHKIFIVYEK